jgi:hypothetical protein
MHQTLIILEAILHLVYGQSAFTGSKFRREYCPIFHRKSVHDDGNNLLFRMIIDAVSIREVSNLGE